ncbi:MAG TPA: tetratricopeptide repeat protein [Edaphocola sp.]|nr:tetratricopeptide repeat protein [Edaphocola sp.]
MKIIRLLFLLLFSFTSSFAQDTVWYNKMDDSLRFQNSKLIHFYNQENKKFPNNFEVLQRLGIAYLIEGEDVNAVGYFDKALAINSECNSCYFGYAHIANNKNNFKEALKQINKALSINDKKISYYLLRSQIYLSLNNKIDAEEDLQYAIQIDTSYYGSYYQKAVFMVTTGRVLNAITAIEKCLNHKPNFIDGIDLLCNLYIQTDQYEEAMNLLNKFILQSPEEAVLYHHRGQLYFQQNKLDSAISDYNKLVELDPKNPMAYRLRGLAKYHKEAMDEACSDYAIAKDLFSKSNTYDEVFKKNHILQMEDFCNIEKASYYYQRGIAKFNHEKFNEAIYFYDEGLKHFKNNSMIYSFKANALLRLNQLESAIENYRFSNQYFSNYKNELELSSKYEHYSEKDKEVFLKAVYAMNLYNISECYYFLGNSSSALVTIDSALYEFPSSNYKENIVPMGIDMFEILKAKILLQNLQFKEAAIVLDKILITIPDHPEAKMLKVAIMINSELDKPDLVRYQKTSIGYNNMNLFSWDKTSTSKSKVNEQTINKALQICDELIRKQPNFAMAYLIRGQIKWLSNQPDYCYDLIKAKQLDANMVSELTASCL